MGVVATSTFVPHREAHHRYKCWIGAVYLKMLNLVSPLAIGVQGTSCSMFFRVDEMLEATDLRDFTVPRSRHPAFWSVKVGTKSSNNGTIAVLVVCSLFLSLIQHFIGDIERPVFDQSQAHETAEILHRHGRPRRCRKSKQDSASDVSDST